MSDKTEVCNFFSIAVKAWGSIRDGETTYRGSLGGQPIDVGALSVDGRPRESLNANIASTKADIENDAGRVESPGADIASQANGMYGTSGRASESCIASGQ